jgi:hypothetical protein
MELGVTDPAGAMGQVIQEDVFGDGEGADEVELLHHQMDAGLLGGAFVGGGVGLSVEFERSRVGGGETGEDTGQGAFAGAVFADEGMDLTGEKVEVDAVQDGSGVALTEATHGEGGAHELRGVCGLSSVLCPPELRAWG